MPKPTPAASHTPVLMGYREIVEKDGPDIDDIFYVRSFVRLWDFGSGYQVTAQQSGNGNNYFSLVFDGLEAAQKVYDTVQGVLAHSKVLAKAEEGSI